MEKTSENIELARFPYMGHTISFSRFSFLFPFSTYSLRMPVSFQRDYKFEEYKEVTINETPRNVSNAPPFS